MFAEKFVTYTDSQGRLTGLPTLKPNEKVEIILLRQEASPVRKPRKPPESLRGSATVAEGFDWTESDFCEEERKPG
jgi:hypothetical protein